MNKPFQEEPFSISFAKRYEATSGKCNDVMSIAMANRKFEKIHVTPELNTHFIRTQLSSTVLYRFKITKLKQKRFITSFNISALFTIQTDNKTCYQCKEIKKGYFFLYSFLHNKYIKVQFHDGTTHTATATPHRGTTKTINKYLFR